MMSSRQKVLAFLNKGWVSSIGVFICSQLIFMTFQRIGWHPKFKEINNEFIANLMDSVIFTEWFAFYSQPEFNVLTVFFTLCFLIPGIIGGIRAFISIGVKYENNHF